MPRHQPKSPPREHEPDEHSDRFTNRLHPHAHPNQTQHFPDPLDAWTRAEDLRLKRYARVVYKGVGAFGPLREAVRSYTTVRRDVVRAKNQLKGLYRTRGISDTGNDLYAAETRGEWIAKLTPLYRRRAQLLGEKLDGLMTLYAKAEDELLRQQGQAGITKRLRSVPGIGPIRATQIVAAVVTPFRFRTKRQFWSYVGLGIVTRESAAYVREKNGDWTRKTLPLPRGLNRQHHSELKAVFKGAAETIAMRQQDHDPLYQDYQRWLAHTKPNLAKLSLARKVAAIVLSIWKHQEDYDPKHLHRPASVASGGSLMPT